MYHVTEAVISVQNETQCEEISEKIEINNAEPCNNDTALEKGCECNETVSSTAQNPETTLQNNKLNLMTHNSTDRTNENDTKYTQENTYNEKNHDAILKISKNDKVTNMHNKTNGHPKNSLRKKRSLNHNEDARYAESVPLIVNYKTSHSDEDRDKPFERIRNVIKNSDLADFNIETLHENSQPKNKQNVKLQHKTNYILPKVQHEKSESNEDDNREGYIRNSGDKRPYNSKVSSEERDQYNDDNKKPEHETEIHSYRENKDSIKNKQKPQYDRNESSRESDDSRENNEESGHTQRNNSYKDKEDSAENSREPEYENNKDSYREREDSVENEREPRYKENANISYKDTDDSRETKDVNTNSNYRDSEERKGKEDYRNTNSNYRDSKERKGKEDYRNTNSNYRDSEEKKGKEDYRNTNSNYRDSEERKGKEDYRNTNSNYRDSEERKGKEDYVDDKENISRENAPYVNNNNVNENDDNNRKLPYPDERDYSNKESQESNEGDYYNKAPKLVNNKETYDDLPKQYPPNSESHENKQSEESNYPRNDFPRNRKESYSGSPKQSQDIYENESNKGSSSVESQEYDKSVDKKSPYTQSNTDSKDSIENDSSEQRQPSTNSDSVEDKYSGEVNLHLKENPPNSYPKDNNDEEEEEAIIAIMKKKRPQVHNDHDELNTRNDQFKPPIKISYENHHVNNKGIVAPVEVGPITHENYDTDSQVEIAPTATPIPIQLKEEIEQFSRSIESIEEPINSDVNSKIPININDGDIRPVVEINSDNSEESQENSKEAFITNPDKQDTSLERLLGVKLTDNEDKNEKIVEGKNRENVKQQFERIPLNYNHDKNQQSDDNERGLTAKEDHSTTEPENNAEENNDQGTVDAFVPENHHYDEKLNIKFDDVTIKLPEIKLPADILSYAYEEPSYDKRKYKKKPKFYQYSDENVDEDTPKNNNYKNKKEKDDEDDEDDEHNERRDELHHSYPSYYSNDEKKNEYRKNEKTTEEDEDIDLYEKFVRERFGKRGSFEKRSEKLQNAPTSTVEADEQLYSTLQQVLKKTEDLKQQAEKSGDPNAGFMWTLEYGKKLR